MASAFTYKRTTVTNLKLTGFVDTDNMTIDLDGETKSLTTLLSDFNGGYVEITVKVKDEEELEEPVSE